MADVDHPKTHIEDQEDADLPRVQPESPKREGIDPLTESDTMYPREDVKGNAEKVGRKEAKAEAPDRSASEQLVADQNNLGNDGNVDEGASAPETTDTDEDNVNADGKLPKDAKTANHKSSDKQNTSASNKPATKDATKNNPKPTTDAR